MASLLQTVDAKKGKIFSPDLLIALRRYVIASANAFFNVWGHGRVVSTLDTTVGVEYLFLRSKGPKFAAAL